MLEILYQDKSVIVCKKPVGVLSERGENPRERCMPAMLEEQTRTYRVDVVHRLDKAVGGVMVFSKNARASAALSRAILQRELTKEYLAVVSGCPEEPEGEWRDYLFRDKVKNKSFVVNSLRRGAKEAVLSYRVLETVDRPEGKMSLLLVRLHTGRTHQIRVQCASRHMPLLGDEKYGSRVPVKNIALWSHHLAFAHPVTGRPVDISALPPKESPWEWFHYLQE